jgi:hypothetical protein
MESEAGVITVSGSHSVCFEYSEKAGTTTTAVMVTVR